MIRFIGFYDYTVILTYLSLISSVFGMTQAIHGDYKEAVFCLVLSGICDAFDGRVAHSKKNRTADTRPHTLRRNAPAQSQMCRRGISEKRHPIHGIVTCRKRYHGR